MRTFIIALIGLLSHAGDGLSQSASISRTKYKVMTLQGEALTRYPNSIVWRRLKVGSILRNGQLVQITPTSSLTLQEQDSRREDQAVITIQAPMIVRIGPTMLRDVKLTKHFLHKIPEIAAMQQETPLQLFLDEAWKKTTAIFSGGTSDPGNFNLMDLQKQGMAMGLSAKSLKILTPASNSLISYRDLPIEVKMAWTNAASQEYGDKDAEYYVFVWETTKQKGMPTAITKDDFRTLTFQRPGSYFMQVTTSDGKWQSPAKVIHISPAIDSLASSAPDGTPRSVPAIQEKVSIDLFFPRSDYTIYAKRETEDMQFFWKAETSDDQDTSVLIITNLTDDAQAHQMEPKRIVVDGKSSATVKLGRGTYAWYLEASSKRGRKLVKSRSEIRRLVIAEDREKNHPSMIPAASGTYFLADGL